MNAEDGRVSLALLEQHLSQRPDCPIPLYVRDWLLRAIADHRLKGVDLAKALGLRLVGHDSLATQARRDRRDAALRQAGALLGDDASALAAAVRRFENATWPRWKAYVWAPAEASALHRALFAAFQDGPIPTSTKQLSRILNRTSI